MNWTSVINIRHAPKGWQNRPDEFVYIGRAGKGMDGPFGNPFRLTIGEARGTTIARYEAWLLERIETNPAFREAVKGLSGKTLVCFCKPAPCHGDVLARIADVLAFSSNDENAGSKEDR